MNRIIVDGRYTYTTEFPLKLGDMVLLPTAYWLRDVRGDTWEGEVTQLGSDYDGHCESVLGVCDA